MSSSHANAFIEPDIIATTVIWRDRFTFFSVIQLRRVCVCTKRICLLAEAVKVCHPYQKANMLFGCHGEIPCSQLGATPWVYLRDGLCVCVARRE